MFHSHQTLALALDTDPGVDSNQKQGAKRVLTHSAEAYQTCKASKWLCKCLICNGDFEAYHAADGFHGLICLRANKRLAEKKDDERGNGERKTPDAQCVGKGGISWP